MAIVKITLDVSKVSTITSVLRQRQNDRTAYTADVVILRNGEAVDLTDTKILFEGTTSKGAKIIDDSGIVIKDAKNGQFTYSMPAVALQDIGAFKTAYFSLTKGETRETTNDFAVFVLASVDISADETGDYLSEYEKLLQQLRTLYDSYDIDAIEAEMAEIRTEMSTLQTDIDKQLATAKADVEQQLANAKAEIQSTIDEITKTLTDKDVAIRGEENHFTAKMIVDVPIEGNLATQSIPSGVTYADIFKNMPTYGGTWQMTTAQAQADVNSPVKAAHVLTVTPSLTANAGWIQVSTYTYNQRFATSVSGGVAMGWKEVATADNVGIADWQPNMTVGKGQMITFKSLGTTTTGLLTNPVFMSLINQNTGSSFPAADSLEGVSGKWKLVNKDAYLYNPGTVKFPYGFEMQLTRIGNMIIPYPNGRTVSTVPSNTRMELGQEQMPVGLRIINRLGDNSGVTLRVVDEDGADYIDYLISSNGKIYTTSLNGFPSGNFLRGFSTPYETGDVMKWAAGVPTV